MMFLYSMSPDDAVYGFVSLQVLNRLKVLMFFLFIHDAVEFVYGFTVSVRYAVKQQAT